MAVHKISFNDVMRRSFYDIEAGRHDKGCMATDKGEGEGEVEGC